MTRVKYTVNLRTNSEFMSPEGKVPFIKVEDLVIYDFDSIVNFISSKGHNLSERLDDSQRGDMRAYMSMVDSVLHNAELYISWCDKETLEKVTKERYGSPFPWPLNRIIPWYKKCAVQAQLKTTKWASKAREQVCE